MHSDYSFEARWGSVILDGGISTTPTIILEHQGELGLTNGELALVVQVFSYKWTARDPYVFASTLADRMGTTAGNIRQLTHKLKRKGYLVRYCVNREENHWVWDFSGLLKAALKLAGGTPGPGDGVPEPEPEAEAEPEAEPERISEGVLAIANGGVLAIANREVEAFIELEQTTTADSSDTTDPLSDRESRCDVVVVENEPKSTPNPDPNPPGEAALDASPEHSSDDGQQSTPTPPGDNRGASEDSKADPPEGPEMVNETIEELRQVGICICLAGKFVQEYGAARCAEVLGALKGLPQRPENPAGWVRKALEQEWIVRQPDPPEPQDSPAKQDLERVEREQLRRQQEEVEKVEEERRKLAEASPYRDLWEEVKEKLSRRIMPQSMAFWFSMCYVLEASEGRMVLSAPSKFKADWIVENYEDLLEEITGREVEVVAGEEKQAA